MRSRFSFAQLFLYSAFPAISTLIAARAQRNAPNLTGNYIIAIQLPQDTKCIFYKGYANLEMILRKIAPLITAIADDLPRRPGAVVRREGFALGKYTTMIQL